MSDATPIVTPSVISRRHFLQRVERLSDGVVCAAVCGALPVLLSACSAARTRYVSASRVGDQLAVRRAEVPVGGGVLIEVSELDLPVFIRNEMSADGTDRYSAVSTKCTHRGCQVEPTTDRLACPCHGSEFTFAGDLLRGPSEQPLVKYQVSTEGENLFVHLRPSRDR